MKFLMKQGYLDDPAGRVAAQFCLHYLAEAESAWERFRAGTDKEALHDLRVGLRRLRVYLQSHRKSLGRASTKKMRRRFREIARLTGHARDLEVWAEMAAGHLDRDPEPEFAKVREKIQKLFGPVADKFRKRVKRLDDSPKTALTFAEAQSVQILKRAQSLHELLEALKEDFSMTPAHEARIAVKKLRYLVEPLSKEFSEAADLARRLKKLQGDLGDLHDLDTFIEQHFQPSLTRVAEKDRDRLKAEIKLNWLSGQQKVLLEDAHEVSQRLASW